MKTHQMDQTDNLPKGFLGNWSLREDFQLDLKLRNSLKVFHTEIDPNESTPDELNKKFYKFLIWYSNFLKRSKDSLDSKSMMDLFKRIWIINKQKIVKV
jgi:hypothetical protein